MSPVDRPVRPEGDDGLHTRVVRTLGSNRLHVVDVPAGQFATDWFISEYLGVDVPVVARCGALLRDRRAAVCMEVGARVTCSRCRRITGIERAPENNVDDPRALLGAGETTDETR